MLECDKMLDYLEAAGAQDRLVRYFIIVIHNNDIQSWRLLNSFLLKKIVF